jgi:hypothetical protein
MIHIEKAVAREEYRLEVVLDSGSTIILNLESKLSTARFSMLREESFFKKVSTDGNFVRWDDKLEISLSELFQLIQK